MPSSPATNAASVDLGERGPVGPRVHPHRAAELGRDPLRELQARQAVRRGPARESRHRHAGPGQDPVVRQQLRVAPQLVGADDRGADPRVDGDHVAAPAEDPQRQRAAPELGPQARRAFRRVGQEEPLRGPADAHRRVARERLLGQRTDPRALRRRLVEPALRRDHRPLAHPRAAPEAPSARRISSCTLPTLPAPSVSSTSPGASVSSVVFTASASGPPQRAAAVPVLGDRRGQPLGVDPRPRRLAGGVDVGHDHLVGVVEAARELVEQRLEPRVAVRLEQHDDPPLRDRLAQRGQRGADLGRVVAVVVDDQHAAGLAAPRHAAVGARGTPPAPRPRPAAPAPARRPPPAPRARSGPGAGRGRRACRDRGVAPGGR